jgi:hypothetical protein
MNKAHIRQALLVLILALTLLACWWTRQQEATESELAAPIERTAINLPPPASENTAPGKLNVDSVAGEIRLDLKRLAARELAGTDIDPFRTKSWYVAPPPPPPEPPPKPTAPPLPFQFVGKTEDAGSNQPAVYLSAGTEFYTVSVGSKFAGNYQLERIDRGMLTIRYLPLSIIQTLPTGPSE